MAKICKFGLRFCLENAVFIFGLVLYLWQWPCIGDHVSGKITDIYMHTQCAYTAFNVAPPEHHVKIAEGGFR